LTFLALGAPDVVLLVKLSRIAEIQHLASRTYGRSVRRLIIAVGTSEMATSIM
jgi:hypothetical protein